MSALERLDAIDERANAATKGPWESMPNTGPFTTWILGRADRPEDGHYGTLDVVATMDDESYSELSDADAEFIANAREDVPVMATALRAILALHSPEEQQHGPAVCAGCSNDLARYLYPCPTVRIIETELAR